jgi:hypothetical protein
MKHTSSTVGMGSTTTDDLPVGKHVHIEHARAAIVLVRRDPRVRSGSRLVTGLLGTRRVLGFAAGPTSSHGCAADAEPLLHEASSQRARRLGFRRRVRTFPS